MIEVSTDVRCPKCRHEFTVSTITDVKVSQCDDEGEGEREEKPLDFYRRMKLDGPVSGTIIPEK